jgi:hypothetical protein
MTEKSVVEKPVVESVAPVTESVTPVTESVTPVTESVTPVTKPVSKMYEIEKIVTRAKIEALYSALEEMAAEESPIVYDDAAIRKIDDKIALLQARRAVLEKGSRANTSKEQDNLRSALVKAEEYLTRLESGLVKTPKAPRVPKTAETPAEREKRLEYARKWHKARNEAARASAEVKPTA